MTNASGTGSPNPAISSTYDAYGNTATTTGPLAGATTTYVYDADRELVGTIAPNPGESGLSYPAVRTTYNSDGLVTLVERGYVSSRSAWSGFTSLEQQASSYDSLDRLSATSATSGGSTLSLIQYSYDNANRLTCTAVRINPATFGSEPSSACTLGTPNGSANDRITSNTYDAANELKIVTTAYGTSAAANYATETFAGNGEVQTIQDAKSNTTTLNYDGFDRITSVQFPSGGGSEGFAYDANGNVVIDTKRDGSTLTYQYDALNRPTSKTPTGETAISYGYDLLNHMTSATGSSGVSYTYDALGRTLTEATPVGTLSYAYDAAGDVTQLTWPDGFYAQYSYDLLNRVTLIQDSSGGGTAAYATYSYDNLGRRTALARGNSTSTDYVYDGADRLTQLCQILSGGTSCSSPGSTGVTYSFGFNAANQQVSNAASADTYTGHPGNLSDSYTANGLNQYSSVAGTTYTYDPKGNLLSDGTRTFTYDVENRLLTESGGPQALTLTYDPIGRLHGYTGSSSTQFLYAGSNLVAEYSGSTVLRRYVPGPATDEPVLWYEGSGYTDRRWLHADALGSVLTYSGSTGAAQATYTYGPYGEPNAWAGSRYRFTGQIEMPEAQLYYYKARVYDPNLGRFLQTDPAGYQSDVNAYAYVGNDPINGWDSTGMYYYDDPNTGGTTFCVIPDNDLFVKIALNATDNAAFYQCFASNNLGALGLVSTPINQFAGGGGGGPGGAPQNPCEMSASQAQAAQLGLQAEETKAIATDTAKDMNPLNTLDGAATVNVVKALASNAPASEKAAAVVNYVSGVASGLLKPSINKALGAGRADPIIWAASLPDAVASNVMKDEDLGVEGAFASQYYSRVMKVNNTACQKSP